MTTRRVLSATGDVALQLLKLTAASADIFPPLKNAAGGALHIAGVVGNFHVNKDQWRELGEYVRDATASVVQSLAQVDASFGDTRNKLEKLNVTLDETAQRVESELALPKRKRLLKFMQDSEMIADIRKRMDDAIGLFQLGATMTTMIDVGKIFDAVIVNGKTLSGIAQDTSAVVVKTTSISRKASLLGLNATLDKLPRIQGASWDSARLCMENTRAELIKRILAWAKDPSKPNGVSQSGGAAIMLLTAVAGAGKTTLAHTIACKCAEKKQLGSSFFFDRQTEGRNSPAALFTTIAADLSRLDVRLAKSITAAIEDDRSLPSAPISRQFEELVLKPCREYPVAGPIVLVIDALDEAWDDDLLDILRDQAPKLPSTFRIFITSRMRPELGSLLRQPHVTGVELNIREQANLEDIAAYIPHKLRQLAERRNLGGDWPGERLLAEFIAKAGGLFLWVAIVCAHLYHRDDPADELTQLVSKTNFVTGSAEDQMNKLYARILESYDWTDSSFVAGYRRVMGTAIATKTPITVSAMKELYHGQRLATHYTLQKLSPLLTGVSEADHGSQPVRVLHQSLRDFLVIQTTGSPGSMRFNIVEEEQSEELALLCLQLLNRDLNDSTPGTGYLGEDEDKIPGVPFISENAISEALWYACQFWQDHVLDIESQKEIGEPLRKFTDEKMILWMEVVAACGKSRGLSAVRQLVEGEKNEETALMPQWYKEYASASLSLSNRLRYEDRREEALGMIEEAAQIYRELAADRPAAFILDLAMSLNNLSNCLSDLGRREEGLMAIQEAVQLYRELAGYRPAAFAPELASSLNNLSTRLAELGRLEEALAAIQEAMKLYQEVPVDRPAEFTPDLAMPLNNLSSRLSDLGHREEALAVIQQAVQLYRELAVERPAAFTPDLASSLNNLSIRLSDLGHHEEALAAVQEAAHLRRQLAADRPAAFTPDLASSLNNFSAALSSLGRREEALAAIQEAVQLYQKLAADRPAAFAPELASSLNNLSLFLSDLARREEALAAIQQAVQLYQELAADRPAAFTPDLAMALNNLSTRLSNLGHREEALAAAHEATQLRRRLATDRPAAFTPDLASSLNNLSIHLSSLGRREEALAAIQEAVQLYRELAVDQPVAFTPDLAMSLNNLSNRLSNLGHHKKALEAIQEAVLLRRQLAVDQPAAFTPDLAMSLHNLSLRLSALGRHEDALGAIQESVKLRRQISTNHPSVFNIALKRSLLDLADLLTTMGRHPEALTAKDEGSALPG